MEKAMKKMLLVVAILYFINDGAKKKINTCASDIKSCYSDIAEQLFEAKNTIKETVASLSESGG